MDKQEERGRHSGIKEERESFSGGGAWRKKEAFLVWERGESRSFFLGWLSGKIKKGRREGVSREILGGKKKRKKVSWKVPTEGSLEFFFFFYSVLGFICVWKMIHECVTMSFFYTSSMKAFLSFLLFFSLSRTWYTWLTLFICVHGFISSQFLWLLLW